MEPTGIVVLDKPKGLTSHDCVHQMRKWFQTRKVGHTGTLDPEVDGVLPICIGKATKVVKYMSDYDKTYMGEVTFGVATTTEDAHGEVVEEKRVDKPFTSTEIEALLQAFIGKIEQTPPYYSAVKVNGKRLYEYARAGIEVERPTRTVEIKALTLTEITTAKPGCFSFAFSVTCTKGTYIRTLAVDIGKKAGYPAHMSKLTRTASGPFTKADAIPLSAFAQMSFDERLNMLRPLDSALLHFPRVTADKELEKRIRNGAVLEKSASFGDGRFLFYNEQGDCLALYQAHPTKTGLIKPETLFCHV